jgi:hypothetical protein
MLQVEGGPDSFLPPESSKGWAGRLYMCLVPSTTSRPYPLPPNPFSNRYGSKLREKNLANGVDFLWVACFLGPSRATWCAPKRPKQHLKHWGGVGRWAGKGGKSSSSNWIVPTTSTFFDDPKIKWWILKILLHVQLFPNKVERFNFYYTQESERESKLEDANRGEWSKVCIAQMWSQLATCNIGCSPQVLHVALEVLLGV